MLTAANQDRPALRRPGWPGAIVSRISCSVGWLMRSSAMAREGSVGGVLLAAQTPAARSGDEADMSAAGSGRRAYSEEQCRGSGQQLRPARRLVLPAAAYR